MRRTLTVILASDVADYSRLVADHEEETIERFRQAAAMFSDLVKKYQGSVFNTAGDAILAQFDSAVDATRCALDVQDANNAGNAHLPDRERLLFRIGIAIGDVLVAENGDLLGDAVNVAARLENLAEPGGICISDEVRSHVLNKIRLNIVDLGDQNLRNIPRAVRAFKLVANVSDASAQSQRHRRKLAARSPILWLVLAVAALGLVGSAGVVWYLQPWSKDPKLTVAEIPFDPSSIPLVTRRDRELLSNYERGADFKALAISRQGLGVAYGAPDIESAKREALDRCKARDEKGYCRLYAVGMKVEWSRPLMPLPVDVRTDPMETPLAAEDHGPIRWAINKAGFDRYLQEANPKALAIGQRHYWFTLRQPDRAEGARIAVERCSDLDQVFCLLISIDGFPTVEFPRTHQLTGPFTLAGEGEMVEEDKQRIAQIYAGLHWRALAKSGSRRWYAVNGANSEAVAVEQALQACRAAETTCTLHAIGNFRVGEPVR